MTPAPSESQGCLAAFIAVTLAALLLTLGIFPDLLQLYVPVFVVTTFVAATLGMPLYRLAQRLRRVNLWTALAAGMVTGGTFPVLTAFSYGLRAAWLAAAGYAVVGAVGGAVFFLSVTLPRAPRRNSALLVALTLVAVATTILVRPTLETLS